MTKTFRVYTTKIMNLNKFIQVYKHFWDIRSIYKLIKINNLFTITFVILENTFNEKTYLKKCQSFKYNSLELSFVTSTL